MLSRLAPRAGRLLVACAGSAHSGARGAGAFRFEGDPALGEIRVVPVIRAYDPPALRLDGYVADAVIDSRAVLRQQRMDELARVPDELGVSLPGAIHVRLNHAWKGHFKVGQLPLGARTRLEGALRRHDPHDLEEALAVAARGVGGQATLFTWVTDLTADPLTAEGVAGDRIDTPVGTVVVDLFEEPYRVRAEVGMALVRSDGLVVMRYTDASASLLSPHRSASRVGRDLAIDLAGEVAKMWPDDPRLWEPSPDQAAPGTTPDETLQIPALVERKPDSPLPQVPFTGLRKAADDD